ncbi:MAG: tetratricopeptide repeat protein [Candidatus Hydrogenedentes bacterium]|nr:tetratricopeptide repeat protein [Candidatus Hydrogenedentota bacterium]
MTFGGDNAESYYDEGLTASMKGDLKHAIQHLEKAVQLDPSFLAAYHQLGRCYSRLGDGKRSVEILKKVVSLKPMQVPFRLDLGAALLALGLTQQARDQYEQVITLDPSNGRAHIGLAHVCFSEGRWPAAMAEAQIALNGTGPNFAALYILGRAAKLAGNIELSQRSLQDAAVLIEKAADLSPNQPEGFYLRGEVSFAQDQFSSALEHYLGAEQRCDPQKAYTAYGENFTLIDILRLNKPERARDLGERILKLDPTHKLGQALKNL